MRNITKIFLIKFKLSSKQLHILLFLSILHLQQQKHFSGITAYKKLKMNKHIDNAIGKLSKLKYSFGK